MIETARRSLKPDGVFAILLPEPEGYAQEAVEENLDCVVATTLHSPRKPDPRYTQMALRALGVEASDAVCIGDSPFDYKAADSCCVACALVSTGGDSRESLVENCPRAIGVYDDLRALAKGVFSVEI